MRLRRNPATRPAPPDYVGDPSEGNRRVEVAFRKRRLQFAIDNPDDAVQHHLVEGRFYEAPLLRAHLEHIFKGSTVLDVGANIGNHTMFYGAFGAARVYPFEPNPRANRLLRTTVGLNALDNIDLRYVDLGVGKQRGRLFTRTAAARNLGASRLEAEGEVEVTVSPLDDLEFEGPLSFIKIDVESMEMQVLHGAERTIATHRPALGVEIDNENLSAFWAWVDAQRYHVLHAVKMYPRNINYLCIPRG